MTMRDLRPMAVGEVLDRSFQVLRRHVGTLFVTAVLGTAPLLLIYLTAGVPYGASIGGDPAPAVGMLMVLMLVLFVLTAAVSWAALTREVDQTVTGGTVSFADGLKHGLRWFPRVVALVILVYLTGALVMIPAALVGAAVGAAGMLFLGEGAIAVTLTFALMVAVLVLAGLLWAPMAFMSLPALIAEGTGPIRALKRAHGLGKGGRVRVVATALVAWIVMMLPTLGIPFLLGMGMDLWTPDGAGTIPATQFYLYQAISFLVGGLTTPFMVAVMVFTYYDRRVRREGYDMELVSESIPQSI